MTPSRLDDVKAIRDVDSHGVSVHAALDDCITTIERQTAALQKIASTEWVLQSDNVQMAVERCQAAARIALEHHDG